MANSSSNDYNGAAELQQLLALKRRHDAESAALHAKIQAKMRAAPQSASLPQRDARNTQSVQRQDVPRTYSDRESHVVRDQHSSREHRNSLPASRSLSQRSSQMSRSASNNVRMSSRPAASNPFSDNGHDAAPLPPPLVQWAVHTEDPYHSFQDFAQMRRSSSRRLSHAAFSEDMATLDVGEDPATYLAARSESILVNNLPPPTLVIHSSPSDNLLHNEYTTEQQFDNGSDHSNTPTMTTATTQPSEMSRQCSSRTEAANGFAMMRIDSNFSTISNISGNDYVAMPQNSFSTDEQNVLVRGIGGAIANPQIHKQTSQSVEMERSSSSESNSSTTSSRSREALQRSNQLAATRKLKPKVQDKMQSHKIPAIAAKPIPISKSSNYVRPKRDPLLCQKCNDKPEGYRGPHELNRHIQRAHSTQVKKWKIIDPTPEAIKDCPPMIKPISKCKACSDGKTYGIDYNAAAHLRRTHFVAKSKSKGRSSKGSSMDKADKKSSKGSGDYPEMKFLRPWLIEIIETKTADLVPEDEEDEEFDVNELDGIFADDLTGTDGTSNESLLTPSTDTLDAYPTPLSNKGFEMTTSLSQQDHLHQISHFSPPQLQTQSVHLAGNDFASQLASHDFNLQEMTASMSASLPNQLQYINHDPNMQMQQALIFDSSVMFEPFNMDMNTINDSTFSAFQGNFFPHDSSTFL